MQTTWSYSMSSSQPIQTGRYFVFLCRLKGLNKRRCRLFPRVVSVQLTTDVTASSRFLFLLSNRHQTHFSDTNEHLNIFICVFVTFFYYSDARLMWFAEAFLQVSQVFVYCTQLIPEDTIPVIFLVILNIIIKYCVDDNSLYFGLSHWLLPELC